MQQSRAMEISTGLFVLLGFAALFFLVTQITNRQLMAVSSSTYGLRADYENVGSLKVGAPVSMSGVTVGRVESITYDQNIYKAVVRMRIDSEFNRIPDDSDAAIMTPGLLRRQYVGITAGGSEQFFADGGQFQLVQDALVLENLINQLVANFAGGKKDEASGESKEAK